MRNLSVKLWGDDGGALIAAEWVFVATILVLGSITGLVAVRQAVLAELHDVANALLALNQSYSFSGQSNCQSSTAGSQFVDTGDSIMVGSTAAVASGKHALACD
jgi:hypothetical protein